MRDVLFEPLTINAMTLKNRICMPAMHMNMAREFLVTDELCDFYAERARGGAGLIIAGYATVDALSGNPFNIGAHDEAHIPGLQKLAAAIKDNGACAAVQINHAGRYNYSFVLDGEQPVAPSAVASRMTRETPRALSRDEIKQIIDSFAQAAHRVKKAGFDAVEVLSGTGYLISEFLSPITNKRDDEYGGSFENRMRFGLDVIRAIRAAVGTDFPIIVRINGNDYMPGGNGREDLQTYARELEKAGADALNINVGWHEARVPQIVAEVPRGVFGYLSKGIRDAVSIPVFSGHRINDPATARELIADGLCDGVSMGRPLIADPYLPEKARTGREQDIVHCIACAQGCFDNIFKLQSVECLCNPKAGHEREARAETTKAPKNILVVGGGPAGMSAALAAHELGHTVTLVEKTARLGGQLYLAAAPPGRAEFAELARDLAQQVAVAGIRVLFNQEADEAFIEREAPDEVILATGAEPILPRIPGADRDIVVQAWDVLSGACQTGKNVVIVGGGAVGIETALFLAEKGTLSGDALKFLFINKAESPEDLYELALKGTKTITIIEMLDAVGKDIGRSTRWCMMQDIDRANITAKTASKVVEITDDGIRVEQGGAVELIPADTVVLAVGSRSYNPLQNVLEARGIAHTVAGDAKAIALAFDATHAGFAAGRKRA